MNSLKVGNIIKVSDSNNPDTVGAIIDVNKNNLICFNIDQNKNPMFYKVDLDHVVFSFENGNINTPNFIDIKKAILKYYHIHKDNKDEVKVLKKIMDFAYPNGIPELTDNSNHLPSIENENSQLLELIVTDSIPLKKESKKIRVVSCAPLFADVMHMVQNNNSISGKFLM